MSDQYPENLIVEIDRKRLQNYYCLSAFFGVTATLLFLGGFATIGRIGDQLKSAELKTINDLILFCVRGFAFGIGLSVFIALLVYFIFFHRAAARRAASLEVTVEGSFLRVRQHATLTTDRKLHFRAIVDYATIQGWLMRKCGIHALQMTVFIYLTKHKSGRILRA